MWEQESRRVTFTPAAMITDFATRDEFLACLNYAESLEAIVHTNYEAMKLYVLADSVNNIMKSKSSWNIHN